METRANYALVGAFTLAVVAAALGFVYWFATARQGTERRPVKIVFAGSVSGLQRGGAVRFNGLNVGTVASLALDPDDPGRVVARVDLDASAPLKQDTKARLESQGLTGQVGIQLTGGSRGAPALAPDAAEGLPVIYADRSDFQDLLEAAQRIAAKADATLGSLQRVVSENEGALGATIRNVEGFTRTLAANGERLDRTMTNLEKVSGAAAARAEDIDRAIRDAADIVAGFKGTRERLDRVLLAAEQFLGTNGGAAQGLIADASAAARSFRTLADNLDKRTAEITAGVKSFTGPGLRDIQALASDARRAINDAGKAARTIERDPSQVIFGGKGGGVPEYRGR